MVDVDVNVARWEGQPRPKEPTMSFPKWATAWSGPFTKTRIGY